MKSFGTRFAGFMPNLSPGAVVAKVCLVDAHSCVRSSMILLQGRTNIR